KARAISKAPRKSGRRDSFRREIYAELGEALAGKVPSRANEITIFKSLGIAVEDIAAPMLVYRSAVGSWLFWQIGFSACRFLDSTGKMPPPRQAWKPVLLLLAKRIDVGTVGSNAI